MSRNLCLMILGLMILASSLLLSADATPLRLGMVAYRGELAARTQWTPFATWLGEQCDRPGELVPLPLAKVCQAAAEGSIELVLCGPGPAARMVHESGAVPIANWRGKDGSTRMAGVVIANPKAGISGLADLRGRKVMTFGDDSAGGWQVQAAMLVARGLDPGKDLQRTVTKKFDDIVLAVKAGVFDAGFIRDGVIEDMVAKQRLAPGDVIVVEAQPAEAGYTHARTTPFYPEWYLLATKGSQDLAKTIAALCLAMPADHPALAKTEASGWVAPADLSPTLDVLRLLKQAPFDH